MFKDGQVRKLLQDLQAEHDLAVAARRAGMDEKTARKYRSLGVLPSSLKQPRTYRTRPDPLAELQATRIVVLEALAARGITDPALVTVEAWGIGGFGDPADGDDIELGAEQTLLDQRAEYEAADAAETIDCYFDYHSGCGLVDVENDD